VYGRDVTRETYVQEGCKYGRVRLYIRVGGGMG
jgi:hypothetical protein